MSGEKMSGATAIKGQVIVHHPAIGPEAEEYF